MQLLRPIMTIMLLGCVLLAPVAGMDIVVCFGADGHITLEPARNGRCGSATWSSSDELSQLEVLLLKADHCGPCVDMPVLTGDAREHPFPVLTGTTQLHVPVLAPATQVVPLPLALFPTPLRSASALALSPTLVALRTIVLLI